MDEVSQTMEGLLMSYETAVWYVPGEGHFLVWTDATGEEYTCLIDEGQE